MREEKRFIVIILDGFGIGAMEDTKKVRPQDSSANTLKSILDDFPKLALPNLERLGLMNAYGNESEGMVFSAAANYGKSALLHYGADTFMGHQEIMGTLPKKPDRHPFQEKVEEVAKHLLARGHQVKTVEREGLRYLVCDDYVTIGDNLEADPGMCYNVTAPLAFVSFEAVHEVAKTVREVVAVGRVIVFGGTGNTMQDLCNAEETRDNKYIGIASAKSKSYQQGYQCRHLGYGVDKEVQAPTILTKAGYDCVLIGKVADIVANDGGTSISCVPTEKCLDKTVQALKKMETGFICTNIQETDLAGHSQSSAEYKQILELADRGIGEVMSNMGDEDVLVVQADHGNDPNIGHSKHTREYVPLLVYKKGIAGRHLGIRTTMSDVGASVCDFFGVGRPANGESFLDLLTGFHEKLG